MAVEVRVALAARYLDCARSGAKLPPLLIVLLKGFSHLYLGFTAPVRLHPGNRGRVRFDKFLVADMYFLFSLKVFAGFACLAAVLTDLC